MLWETADGCNVISCGVLERSSVFSTDDDGWGMMAEMRHEFLLLTTWPDPYELVLRLLVLVVGRYVRTSSV